MGRSNKNFVMITLGCPKNEVDSGVLAGELIRGGMNPVGSVEEADVVFVNTCGFIEEAKKESIETILQTVELKKNGSHKKIYVWGCLSERYKGEIEKEFPDVDGFFGVEPYDQIGSLLLGSLYQWNETAYQYRILSTPPHTAYLKIADGCDHTCTFCAIPFIKGRYRSRSMQGLVEEASYLAERGVKEIILVAQDTTVYGCDLGNRTNLVTLIKKLISIQDIQWIRIMYTHPAHITDELIDMIATEDKICRYLDLPLQHISDDILKAMGRGTKRRYIESLIDHLRGEIPDLVLRTTFVVGFPGEQEEDFNQLIDFIRERRFERLGAFIFSPEEGTVAFSLKPRVPKKVAQHRYRILMEIQQDITRRINYSCRTKILPVIVDGYNQEKNLYFGRSEGDGFDVDQTVWIKGKTQLGEIIQVRINSSSQYDLMGTVL
jgi:ribosomal protein S12 methylthiotransferase